MTGDQHDSGTEQGKKKEERSKEERQNEKEQMD